MLPFDKIFIEIARCEVGVIYAHEDARLPDGTYIFREFFSESAHEPQRIELRVYQPQETPCLATFSYHPDATDALLKSGPRVTLTAGHPQSGLAQILLFWLEHMLEWDPDYATQLAQHHALWRQLIDDPVHPHRGRFNEALKEKCARTPMPLRWWIQ